MFFFWMWLVLFISTKLSMTDSSEMLKRVHVVMLMQPMSAGLGSEIFTDVCLLKGYLHSMLPSYISIPYW
jgi:hypothetical protein